MKKKWGRIKINRKHYEEVPNNVCKTLSDIGFIPYKVEYCAMTDCFELQGFATVFKELKPNEIMPEYELSIIADENGKYIESECIERTH